MVPRAPCTSGLHDDLQQNSTKAQRTPSQYSSSSREADDERSSSSRYSMGPVDQEDPALSDATPTYPGEDLRPTSRKEIYGFYAYSFATEVFVVCGLGAFIPMTLESLARESATAVLADDHSKPCRANGIEVHARSSSSKHGGSQCVFTFLGAELNTASFAMYTFSVSVLLQTILVVTMSGAADHGRYRKTLLLTFALVGALATMLWLPVTPQVYFLGSLWAMVGNVCFGASAVLLNSILPLLVRHHPDVVKTRRQEERRQQARVDSSTPDQHLDVQLEEDLEDSTTALLPAHEQPHHSYIRQPIVISTAMQISTRISAYGLGIGYIAAITVQILSIVVLKLTGATLFSLRLVLFMIGLWWFAFTIPAAFWLRPRPGPPLSFGKEGEARSWTAYLTYSWTNLGKTILRARRLKDVLLFLAAWFMISDAIATVSGTAILFAKTTLGMESSALAFINVITILGGIAGAFTWSTISRMMDLKPSQTILTCICLFELIPLYGLLGYIPAIHRFGSFGLQQQWEMYPLGAVYGLVLGGLSSYCRSLFGELIPPGSEAAFYALYAITDKGSSVFGPAIVGAITDATGDIRPAFWFLAVLIGMPIPLMFLVDVERGKREGAQLVRESLKGVVLEESGGEGEEGDVDDVEYEDGTVR